MDDLISKYFREDLTEAEEKAVAEILGSSPDEAERLRGLAEARYKLYGLPEATRPNSGPSGGPSSAGGLLGGPWIPSLVLLGFLGAMLGLGFYFFTRKSASAHGSITSDTALPNGSEGALSDVPSDDSGLATDSSKTDRALGTSHGQSSDDPNSNGGSAQAISASKGRKADFRTVPSSVAHDITPQLASKLAPGDYSNLGVLVNQAATGPVVVRVTDEAGNQKMVIYNGVLNPGEWVFNWDGHYPDGRLLEPGYYRVEVNAGAVTQSRRISITAP